MYASKLSCALLAFAAIGLLSCGSDAAESLGRRLLSEEDGFPQLAELSRTRPVEETPPAVPELHTDASPPEADLPADSAPPTADSLLENAPEEDSTNAPSAAPSDAVYAPETAPETAPAPEEDTQSNDIRVPAAELQRLATGRAGERFPIDATLQSEASDSPDVPSSDFEADSPGGVDIEDRRKKRSRNVHPGQCRVGPAFWTSEFREVVSDTLGGFSPKECHGDPNQGGQIGNKALAISVKNQLMTRAGCVDDFEVLVWAGVHGHDHQGANVITARDSQGCDGGMYGINPGSLCESKGGTVHRFCTGQGKSYAIFINPKGRRTRNLDVLAIAQSCKAKVNLLIDFTKCIEDGPAGKGLRGVIVLPYDGIEAPNGKSFRHNQWAITGECTTKYWLFCSRANVGGRDIAIFAVQPLA